MPHDVQPQNDGLSPVSSVGLITSLRAIIPGGDMARAQVEKYAEHQAATLLRLAGVTEPPVRPSIVEAIPTVAIEVVPELPVHGSVFWLVDHWVISVAAEDPPLKQRHTIFHEFKHVLDHPTYDGVYRRPDGGVDESWAEAIADHFSMCVLAPEAWVRDVWNDGTQDVEGLSCHFEVTENAMRLRLWRLGYTGCGPTCGRRLPAIYRDTSTLEGNSP